MVASCHGLATALSAIALAASDLLAVLVAVAICAACVGGIGSGLSAPWPVGASSEWHVVGAVLLVVVIHLSAMGRYTERIPFWLEVRTVLHGSLYAACANILFGLLSDDLRLSAIGVAAIIGFSIFAVAGNSLVKLLLSWSGIWTLPVVVIGDATSAAEARDTLETDWSLGYRFVGQVDPGFAFGPPEDCRLASALRRHRARGLLIAADSDMHRQRRLIACALRERIPFAVAPQARPFSLLAGGTTRCAGDSAIAWQSRSELTRPVARLAKTAIDVSLAAILLVVTSPLFLVIAIASRLDGGPIFFAHRRVGAGGRAFPCLKFRTMVVDSDRMLAECLARDPAMAAEWAATRKLTNDPRITRVGRFLRKTSLDELPQLLNVLQLQMSLVGPRPIVESEIALYGEDIAQYYAGRPGLTGLWQVSGRSDTSYARRVELDVWYVNNWTIWNDIAVLLMTIPAVLSRQGAR
jgi:undecaprenyl-phosphate galactose phosphotransferase